MDRRRLEHAHVRFALLNVTQWYKESFIGVSIMFSSDQSEATLLEFTPLYQAAFYKKYSGMYYIDLYSKINNQYFIGHRCSKAWCGQVLVIDGNLKNHRSVCAATEAGYIQYAGLPGSIKSGCTNTPCQKSRFCQVHKPRTQNEGSNKVIEMLLEKTLRSQKLYKVSLLQS